MCSIFKTPFSPKKQKHMRKFEKNEFRFRKKKILGRVVGIDKIYNDAHHKRFEPHCVPVAQRLFGNIFFCFFLFFLLFLLFHILVQVTHSVCYFSILVNKQCTYMYLCILEHCFCHTFSVCVFLGLLICAWSPFLGHFFRWGFAAGPFSHKNAPYF